MSEASGVVERGAMRSRVGAGAGSRLTGISSFGANPGELRMLAYAPNDLPSARPLVVVLHGCTQTAEGYAGGAGWIDLADRYGFGIVCPEQTSANNPNRCFNWFEPGDTARGKGEAASIRSMIEEARRRFGSDAGAIYVTGLSAGGAMASVMLACYPEVFAGGGVIAGLPYGVARGMPEAFMAMSQGHSRRGPDLGGAVRQASPHKGPWPSISVWHGAVDKTVKPANADTIVEQWLDVWGPQAKLQVSDDGRGHKSWTRDGVVVIERRLIAGLGHGAPLASRGPEGVGSPGPFLLEAGLSSSRELLAFWRIAPAVRHGHASELPPRALTAATRPAQQPAPGLAKAAEHGPAAVIHRALKAAGLMK